MTAKQERHLAELVQQLLQLEGTRKVLGQALGRPPQLEEWAAEAGKQSGLRFFGKANPVWKAVTVE